MKENGMTNNYQAVVEKQPMSDFNIGAHREPRYETQTNMQPETITVFVLEPGVYSRSTSVTDNEYMVIGKSTKGGE